MVILDPVTATKRHAGLMHNMLSTITMCGHRMTMCTWMYSIVHTHVYNNTCIHNGL